MGETQADAIEFSVQYLRPSRLFAIVDLSNQPDEGNIRIASNIISIEGTSVPDPAEYEGAPDNPRNIILNKDGYSATFSKGFSIRDDFTLQMVCKNLVEYEVFCNYQTKSKKFRSAMCGICRKNPILQATPPPITWR